MMRGLDTNVLVRYLTGDDERQSPLARSLIDGPGGPDPRFFVTTVALVELTWTLRSKLYGCSRAQVADAVAGILDSPRFRVQDANIARTALQYHRVGSADFSDYLIAAGSVHAGCKNTLTFDRNLAGHDGCSLIGSGA